MIHLFTENIEVKINPLGAELTSLHSKSNYIEYLWQADSTYWGKYSPVLFPIVGSLKEGTYYYEHKTYRLPRHGFARERVFSVERISETKAVFTLEADAQSLRVYPFHFRFQLIYEVNGNQLSCTYSVFNPNNNPLWFSVGAHPAFKVPLISGVSYESHFLEFEKEEPLNRWHLLDGLIADKSNLMPTEGKKLKLSPSLFYEDAIVLKHLQSQMVTLGSMGHSHGLHFNFQGFPYLGIWAAKDAPFVCIEPWCGHADTVGHNQQLTEKPGIEKLEAGGHWERTWKVEVF
jgi:galactose mutarotase-like enzyme